MQRWLITTGSILLVCGLLYISGAFAVFSDLSLKLLFQLRGERVTSQQIVIIGVDEQTLDELGAWPFPRSVHAKLLDQLSFAQVVGFDFIFAEPTVDDAIFSQALAKAPPTILAAATDYNQTITQPTSTLSGYHSIGIIDTTINKNDSVKQLSTRLQNKQYQYFSQVIAQVANITSNTFIENSRLINYYGPEFTFLYLSYIDILNGNLPVDFFTDRFVLIGAQAIGLGDVHLTPFSSLHPTPGVEIQATILNNILDDSFLQNSNTFVFITLFLLLFIPLLWRRLSEIQNLFLTLLIIVFFCGASYFFFLKNVYLAPSFPAIALLIGYVIHLLAQELATAKTLISRIQDMDGQLASSIKDLYINQPENDESKEFEKISNCSFLTQGIQRHLSHFRQATQALSLQTHFIKHLLKKEAPPIAIWEEKKGKLIIANGPFESLWHSFAPVATLPNLEAILNFLTEKHHNKSAKETEDSKVTLPKTNPIELDICVIPFGKRQFYHATIQKLDPEGTGFSGYLINFTDVSEIHELERVKSEVLSIVSHELKLPLTVIQGYGEMLAGTLPAKQAKFADEICNHTRRLNQMIVDFLDIERIESGKYKLNNYPFDFKEMIEDGIHSVYPTAEKKNISINFNAPAKTTPLIGDETLILQAFINLLDNAVKFSPQNSVVTIDLLEHKNEMILTVTDQGLGISEELQKSIFNKFSRGDHPDQVEGFGLGLALVHQIITSHGGTIIVSTAKENKGAQFMLTLPKKKL